MAILRLRGEWASPFSLEIRASSEGQTVLTDTLFDEHFLRPCRFRRQTHNSFGHESVARSVPPGYVGPERRDLRETMS
jgi:hypothetical protein